MNLNEVLDIRMSLLEQEKKVYLTAVNQINCQMKDLLNNDIGTQFVNEYGRDLAGDVIRKYFDKVDYNINIDEMTGRILKFSYDKEYDPLENNGDNKKIAYNCSTNESISELNNVIATSLNADNIQVRNIMTYSTKYMTEKRAERLMEFYRSSENFNIIDESPNTSIDDTEVDEIESDEIEKKDNYGKSVNMAPKATPEQLVEEVVKNWEREGNDGKKDSKLIERGYLDSSGKVTNKARKELLNIMKKSQDGESKIISKNTDYENTDHEDIKKDTGKHEIKSFEKIVGGQFIYYTMPPLLYEIRMILMDENITLDNAMEKLVKSKNRICKYVLSKLKVIFKGIGINRMKKLIKSLFNTIIDMIKSTIEKMIKLAKNLVLSSVDAIKVVCDKNSTSPEKADSIFNLFSATITTFSIETLCEYIEKQFNITESLLLPIETIITVVCTNFVMLILQKADLFDMRYGLLVSNIEKVIDEENVLYVDKMNALKSQANEEANTVMNDVKEEIQEMVQQLRKLNVYSDDEQAELEEVNEVLDMKMAFEEEWLQYMGVAL